MSEHRNSPGRDRFRLQTIALSLILLPALPLYVMVNAGFLWATWILMGLIAGGMVLGMWVS
ncbi:MAG: hypothetical protein AMJ88_08620 [Anaerolineae bacterium SM23_ 63]|nr:MAG: hypothetical protein AMJ88_08620 [Anaerolineae bacterium SM23_ 63]HEY48085.1 hypothetical protein [Anaerolineae bacterium]